MTNQHIDLNPSTTVYELLEAYPELEDKLIDLAPPFKKLKNPMLRKSVAKIATLTHIASVANIPLIGLINMILTETGQPPTETLYGEIDYFVPQPDWFSEEKIKATVVEGETDEKDKMTLIAVFKEADNIESGEIVELITTFLPAPGIETMKAKGNKVWTTKVDSNTIKTYFLKK